MKLVKRLELLLSLKKIRESSINLEISPANVRTMDEAAKTAAVPDKQNEEYVEADVTNEKRMNDPQYLYEEASSQPKVN